jgi:hypothetical protein
MAALTGPPPHKKALGIAPQVIKDNVAWTCTAIDCKGFDYAVVTVLIGATDIAMAVLMLTECDTSGGSYVEIAATDFSDATQSDIDGTALGLPSATDDNVFIEFHVALPKRKRYLKVSATAGDGTVGTYLAAWADLYQAGTGPNTSAEYGCDVVVRV